MIRTERISLKRLRFDRLLMRRVVFVALAILVVVAIYRAVDPPREIVVERPAVGAPDLPAQLFAREFAAAYLSYDAERPETRTAALAKFASSEQVDDWFYVSPSSGRRKVTATAVEQVYPKPEQQAVYVVAADTTAGPMHLSVTVGRDPEGGALGIAGLPAIVGPTAAGQPIDEALGQEKPVEDAALSTVVERTLKNWFAHQENDLEADLTPDAQVALPDNTYSLTAVRELAELGDGAVVATVEISAASGEQMTLAYEMNVEKRADRWMVSAIETLPNWH